MIFVACEGINRYCGRVIMVERNDEMPKIRVIKKKDDYSLEYEVGGIYEVTGTWYGGVHIAGKSGVPVSLDKDEYMELNTEPE